MKNKSIIDKLIDKNNKGEILFFDDSFDEYMNNYNINKHNINTNTKVYYLLTKKLNQEFKNYYDNYIQACFNEHMTLSFSRFHNIIDNALLNLQFKYKIYKDHHSQYKIINLIKIKYGHIPQDNILYINDNFIL